MEEIKQKVRERYSAVAQRVLAATAGEDELPVVAAGSGCCTPAAGAGGGCCSPAGGEVSAGLYTMAELAGLPAGAVQASLGCGNPAALAGLHPGQTVVDLGSGGGIDVLLAARRVGAAGRVYGVDMNPDMLALARVNAARAGADNVTFVQGEIEQLPLPADLADVILSNCVINLAADKGRALAEAFRVLKPGGRLAVTDMVWVGDPAQVPPGLRSDLEAWAGCVAGALGVEEYRARLDAAGFGAVEIEIRRLYGEASAPVCLASAAIGARKPRGGRSLPEVRPAVPGDAAAIAALLAAAALPVAGFAAHLDGFLVADDAEGLAGCMGLERYGEHALLRSAAVAPRWRGLGLGQTLAAAALDLARRQGARHVYLLTTTAADYFARLGFRPVPRAELPAALGASAELQGACPDAAAAMALDLA